MSQLTLTLPETLHRQLETIARTEGISLGQYILYALTRQLTLSYRVHSTSPEEQQSDQEAWQPLLLRLGQATEEEIDSALAEREQVAAEPMLSPETIAHLQQRIQEQRSSQ